ncbi:WD40-repeat-containing domain protein [Paraphysoderma sedebokerense]|nr:WD40-repeat-containing domain protein [Paraphysoderma sedebokerense]
MVNAPYQDPSSFIVHQIKVNDNVQLVEFCPFEKGQDLLAIAQRQQLMNWSFRKLDTFPVGHRITSLSWSPITACSRTDPNEYLYRLVASSSSHKLHFLSNVPLLADPENDMSLALCMISTMERHNGYINDVTFGKTSGNSHVVASVSSDRTCRVWLFTLPISLYATTDLPPSTAYTVAPLTSTITQRLSSPGRSIRFASSSSSLLISELNGSVRLYEIMGDRLMVKCSLYTPGMCILKSVDWGSGSSSAYGESELIVGVGERQLYVWRVNEGEYIQKPVAVEDLGSESAGVVRYDFSFLPDALESFPSPCSVFNPSPSSSLHPAYPTLFAIPALSSHILTFKYPSLKIPIQVSLPNNYVDAKVKCISWHGSLPVLATGVGDGRGVGLWIVEI